MEETLKMMREILIGKEKGIDEKELINEYKKDLQPNILAYFYSNNFGVIYSTSNLYPILTEEDKASFCLQELDKCLLNFDNNYDVKFITYFIRCYKNRLRMETEQLNTQKRKIIINYTPVHEVEEKIYTEDLLQDINILLEDYNLTDLEKLQCKLLNAGYSMKEIGKLLKQATITIYKRNDNIKKKILNSNINFA